RRDARSRCATMGPSHVTRRPWSHRSLDLPSSGMNTIKRLIASAALAGLVATAGCAGTYGYSEGYYATTPPPAAYVDVRGSAPYAGAVWIDGYWGYRSDHYIWNRGYWTHERPGYTWEAHRWYRSGNGWRLSRGHWRLLR